jgi:thiamine pyrophosphate-dependent acetolactate synthase large subunit-like protein
VRAFLERTQIPFPRSPMSKGMMPDDHPLSVAGARTLALQNADVVFLTGARFNWIFHPGFRRDKFGPPRYAPSRPRRSATTKRPRWPWSAHGSGRKLVR